MSEEHRQLTRQDTIQAGDQYFGCGEWRDYSEHWYGQAVRIDMSRRPIAKAAKQPQSQPVAYEEVPGSRTTQDAVIQPQRERIAYEDLQPGDRIQPGDEWKNGDGRWQPYVCLTGLLQFVQDGHVARRPHRVNTIIIDALADAHAARAQLQDERDKARLVIAQVKAEFNTQAEVLAEVRADEKRLFDDLELLRSECVKLQGERDELRTALRESHEAHEFTMKQGLAVCKERNEANAQIQNLLKTIAENADMFAEHTKAIVHERDEARAERDRLQEVVGNLYNEPTARQVQDMLRTWATELDWAGGCLDSAGRDKVSAVQRVLIVVIERIETMINPEGVTDDN